MNRTELENAIATKQAEIEAKQKEIDNFEIDVDEHEEDFCNSLDEQGVIEIGNLVYNPSFVLMNVDPTAYRCGLNDFVDNLEVADDPGYKELEEEFEGLQDELTDLEGDLEELEEEEETDYSQM